ncbi:DNA polymerase IV [Deinococcus sp. Arct2-2]|uniref:DNA polymerase IV n=1 Tax=Deinococcus sp. Arct2-2 TaxID=2568653 RepID=UPI0010A54E78|nr:DNA polymerase IV [Deinococcus sp. Arct2-2]THF69195.1 DNA polymerase IV [Deinococcus sp. Arct2-2]
MRKIVHVDADAFYASVELRDQPHLRGKPVAVAYHGPRSVVTTATYEARQFGVHSALPLRTALARCPRLIVIEPRMDVYREASRVLQGIFYEFTDLVEPLSLDEAYLDVTEPKQGPPSATLIAREIKRLVNARTGGLTVSCGVSFNKLLSKLGSGMNKPDGLTVILPEDVEALVAGLPVGAFHGIGPVTARRLEERGVKTGADLQAVSLQELVSLFGVQGRQMYAVARGQDDRPVDPNGERKSVGVEETFDQDLREMQQMHGQLGMIAEKLQKRLESQSLAGRTVVLKVKFANFESVSRQISLPVPVFLETDLYRIAVHLLTPELLQGRAVRLLGMTVGHVQDPAGRDVLPSLFSVL